MRQTRLTASLTAPFQVGGHRVDPVANEIDGQRIDSKAMDVLGCLAESAPGVVTHESLLERVWPNVVVGDNVLHQAIAHLRKALGDDARSPHCIENIPRRGYRLIGRIERDLGAAALAHYEHAGGALPGAGRSTERRDPSTTVVLALLVTVLLGTGGWYAAHHLRSWPEQRGIDTPDRSIVVLPLVNLSEDPEQEYFSDGLSEELINVLSRNPELKVTSRTSAFHFKNSDADLPTIARRLGVAHVLEGSVRKSGERIRVTVQLVDARTDKHLWSETFDRTLGDVFALQDEIAGHVFRKLRVTLTESASTRHRTDPGAYLRYLEGRSLLQLDRDDLIPRAAALLEEAVTIDPAFVHGWTELSRAHFRRGDQSAAQRLNDRAASIDPDDPVVNAWYGFRVLVQPVDAQDLERAADHFRRALATDPTNVDVWRQTMFLLTRLGRPRDAIPVGAWVLDRDPMCVICSSILGQALVPAGEFAEAERAFALVLALAPGSVGARAHLALSQLLQGKAQTALATVEGFVHPNPPFQWIRTVALRELGDERILPQTLVDMESDWGRRYPYLFAMGYALAGDHDAAFAWLERSLAFPPETIDYPHLSTALEPLHDDPRWRALLERVGLLPEQLAKIEFDVALPGSQR